PGLSYDTEPHAIVMAFAEAVPVIASRLPVVADRVEPGRNGLLFDPGSASAGARRACIPRTHGRNRGPPRSPRRKVDRTGRHPDADPARGPVRRIGHAAVASLARASSEAAACAKRR